MHLLQILHGILLVVLSLSTRRMSAAVRAAVTLYIFYSIAPAFSFEMDYFSLKMNHHPKESQLLVMLVADAMLLIGCAIAATAEHAGRNSEEDESTFARALVMVALIAVGLDVLANAESLLELKGSSNSHRRLPNLLLLDIPANLILLGAVWRMPFRAGPMRYLTYFGAALSISLSVVQGYRHVALFAMLMWLFQRQRTVGPVVVALFLSGIGEVSEDLKVLLRTAITTGHADVLGYLAFLRESLESRTWLSREQMAIASNWDIFELNRASICVQDEFLSLIPGIGSIVGITPTPSGAEQIASFAGVGEGQGTAFGYGIFLALHPAIACLVLVMLPYIASISGRSIILPLALAFTFGFLRDTPAHWLGQLKFILFLLALRSALPHGSRPLAHARV